jgi:exonuclease III
MCGKAILVGLLCCKKNIPHLFPMNHNRFWKILNWNIRGINAEKKWLAIASKIEECGCDIICIQETKMENFDIQFIRKFAPKRFNKFEFLPSNGASGGMIIL